MPRNIVLSEEQVRAVTCSYASGLGYRQVAATLGLAPKAVRGCISDHGLFRTVSQSKRKFSVLNEGAFGEVTCEMLYWSGFIMADGNVYHTPGRQARVSVTLHARDTLHLVKLSRFVGMSSSAVWINRDSTRARLTIPSDRIASDLVLLGVVPRKSLVAEIPPIIESYCKSQAANAI